MRKIPVALLFILIAVVAFVAGNRYGDNQPGGTDIKSERTILYYTDPMNPGFRSEKPGTAPCGMPLEPVYAEVGGEGEQIVMSGGPPQSPGAVTINRARQQLIGVQISPVGIQPMTYTLRLYGKIIPDETRIYQVNASVNSWVRALSEITTGSIVKEDQVLAEILAPAFYNAQVSYLVTLNNIDRIREQLGGELRSQQTEIADNQVRVAVQSLQNLGITDAQVEELANTRKAQPLMQIRSPANGVILDRSITLYQWFNAGEEFYTIADLGQVWVYADVYEDEAMHLRPGMKVKVRHEQAGRTFEAKISRVLPLFDPVAKTLKVRIDVDNPQYELRPDMFVDVEIPITMEPSLHVPADAVIDSGTRKIIYVETGNSTFEPRLVETGWRLGRQVEITKGLMPDEKIIVSGNFLIDSESRMKTAAGSATPVMSKDPVCGMFVNEEYARLTGKTATYGDKTYYFCMDTCRESFKEEPEKYAEQKGPENEHEHQASMKMEDKSWLQMLESTENIPFIDVDNSGPKKRMKDAIGRPATFPGVVDWDAPNPKKEGEPPRDWTGWGKFPGAEYLGLGKGTGKKFPKEDKTSAVERMKEAGDETTSPTEVPASMPELHVDMSGSDNGIDKEEDSDSGAVSASQSNAGHAGTKHEMPQQPISDQPNPPADR